MPHMQVILDGKTVYDEQVDEWLAPAKPDMIPADVRHQANPNAKPPPYIKAMMLAMIGKALASNLRDPRLAPLDINLTGRPAGFTLAVDMPAPELLSPPEPTPAAPTDSPAEQQPAEHPADWTEA